MAKDQRLFDESAWSIIVDNLPDDEDIRRVVLDDFMWFVYRPRKYKNSLQKIEDYIRHLKLKSNVSFMSLPSNAELFKNINIEKLESELRKKLTM